MHVCVPCGGALCRCATPRQVTGEAVIHEPGQYTLFVSTFSPNESPVDPHQFAVRVYSDKPLRALAGNVLPAIPVTVPAD
jgi:hypothetical protein